MKNKLRDRGKFESKFSNSSWKQECGRIRNMHRYQYEKWALIFFCLAAVSWYVFLVVNPSNWELVFLVLCAALTILFIGFFFICICTRIARKRGKEISPYRVFAIVDIGIGLLNVVCAIWDIRTDDGWFGGLTGVFLLVFVMPVVLLLLVVDYILYKLQK